MPDPYILDTWLYDTVPAPLPGAPHQPPIMNLLMTGCAAVLVHRYIVDDNPLNNRDNTGVLGTHKVTYVKDCLLGAGHNPPEKFLSIPLHLTPRALTHPCNDFRYALINHSSDSFLKNSLFEHRYKDMQAQLATYYSINAQPNDVSIFKHDLISWIRSNPGKRGFYSSTSKARRSGGKR